jgi:transposase InsO family protein
MPKVPNIRYALSQLDDTVNGSVSFGDGSTVKICGLGSAVLQVKQG